MRRLSRPAVWVILLTLMMGLVWLIFDDIQLRGETQRLNRELKQSKDQIAVFFIQSTPTNFYLKPVMMKVDREGDKHLKALEALFSGPPEGTGLSPIFVPETKVLDFELNNGLAIVNLNRYATQLNVGAQGEYLAVASIVNTLTKLPDVYQVKIRIEGKAVDSLAGHVDLTATFEYDNKVVMLD